jgi:diguanylate cyclase (GGDEF)-like protein
LDDIVTPNTAVEVAHRMLEAIDSAVEWEGEFLAVSASIGVRTSTVAHSSGGDILRQADQAMYQAKQSGKNRVVVYDPDSIAAAETQV